MKSIKILFLITSVVILCSCSKFLEPRSQDQFTPKTAEALNEMLLGSAYVPRKAVEGNIMAILTILDDDVASTKLFRPTNTIDPFASNTKINALHYVYTWQPDYTIYYREYASGSIGGFGSIIDTYKNFYALITSANVALDYIDRVSGYSEDIAHVKAQAYALRAYYYLLLVNMYGAPYNQDKNGLGVPIETTAEFVSSKPERATTAEVYAQIISDLKKAEAEYMNIPVSRQWQPNFRTSLPMVQLLMARTYLYMSGGSESYWQEAAEYAEKVINDWGFKLKNVVSAANNTVENNLATYSNATIDNKNEVIWVFGNAASTAINIKLSAYENLSPVDDPTSIVTTTGAINPFLFNASDELIQTYEAGDSRLDKYITKVSKGFPGGFPEQKNYYLNYGKITVGAEGDILTDGWGYTFRLAEAYLILAEAKAMQNQDADAIRALDDLRKTRIAAANYTTLAGTTHAQLLEVIKNERRRELCFEGFRFFDLKRYGMKPFTHKWNVTMSRPQGTDIDIAPKGEIYEYTLTDKDPMYIMEIPDISVQKSQIQQNPMYPGNERPASNKTTIE